MRTREEYGLTDIAAGGGNDQEALTMPLPYPFPAEVVIPPIGDFLELAGDDFLDIDFLPILPVEVPTLSTHTHASDTDERLKKEARIYLEETIKLPNQTMMFLDRNNLMIPAMRFLKEKGEDLSTTLVRACADDGGAVALLTYVLPYNLDLETFKQLVKSESGSTPIETVKNYLYYLPFLNNRGFTSEEVKLILCQSGARVAEQLSDPKRFSKLSEKIKWEVLRLKEDAPNTATLVRERIISWVRRVHPRELQTYIQRAVASPPRVLVPPIEGAASSTFFSSDSKKRPRSPHASTPPRRMPAHALPFEKIYAIPEDFLREPVGLSLDMINLIKRKNWWIYSPQVLPCTVLNALYEIPNEFLSRIISAHSIQKLRKANMRVIATLDTFFAKIWPQFNSDTVTVRDITSQAAKLWPPIVDDAGAFSELSPGALSLQIKLPHDDVLRLDRHCLRVISYKKVVCALADNPGAGAGAGADELPIDILNKLQDIGLFITDKTSVIEKEGDCYLTVVHSAAITTVPPVPQPPPAMPVLTEPPEVSLTKPKESIDQESMEILQQLFPNTQP